MEFDMDGETRLAAIFNALSPENQAHLLTYARLSRIAENAVKKMMAAGPDHDAAGRQEGKSAHTTFSF
ncbi:MAG: hypothetical protein LBI91_05025, partial [Spirochaetaceae bacterium]|nr:hypothetical protein [Spirochaetaceae bacterium]